MGENQTKKKKNTVYFQEWIETPDYYGEKNPKSKDTLTNGNSLTSAACVQAEKQSCY